MYTTRQFGTNARRTAPRRHKPAPTPMSPRRASCRGACGAPRATPIDFLGRPAPTVTIAADLALKFGVPLFPAYGIRDPDGRHVAVVIEAPIPHGTAAEMTKAFSDSLAARVRAHPGQYLWLHQRWAKSLPPPPK